MAKGWVDAEFEVVSRSLRAGDPHPVDPRWRYVGQDACGRDRWRRAPRYSRLQLFVMGCAAILLFRLILALVVEGLHRYWPG